MPRPNLLLITTDQQRFDTIHAAGNPAIFTPHLNWLCDTGIRYTRAYADCPVCAPSRATIMSGLHAHTHGQLGNDGRKPLEGRHTLPGLLTAAGYQTRAVGKMHFNPLRAHYGFEHMEILPDYYRWLARTPGAPQPKNHGVGENEMEPVFATTDEAHSVTHWTVDRSIDFLETRDEARPFFLWTSFSKPHPPFDAPRPYWDIYDGVAPPTPARGDWSEPPHGPPPAFHAPTWHLSNAQRFSDAQIRASRRAYYACISQIDYNLGLLFARMRELGLLDNTWIVFTSDHGEMLGDHRMGGKTVFFEGAAHVPLLVRPPGGGHHADERAGTTDDRLACLADLLPTLLARADTPTPEAARFDGLDLLGPARRAELVGECSGFHALIADDGRKYHFAARGGAELLFDTREDPLERRDLAPHHADSLDEMRRRLADALRRRNHPAAGDTRPVPTGPAPTEADQRRRVWPGFHSRTDHRCDLLH